MSYGFYPMNGKSKFKKESKDKKRSRLDDDNNLDDEFDGHDLPKFMQKILGQGPKSTPKFIQKRVSNLKVQEDGSEILLLGCSKCDRRHEELCKLYPNGRYCAYLKR